MPANDNEPRSESRPTASTGDVDPLALLITRRQRERLLALGITAADLHVMTPTDAHRILRERGERPSSD